MKLTENDGVNTAAARTPATGMLQATIMRSR
jgi:hypothetical protein